MIYKYYTSDVIDLDYNGIIIGNVVIRVLIWRSAYFANKEMQKGIRSKYKGRDLRLARLRRVK